MKRSKLLALRAQIEKAAAFLKDEDALEAVELFPAWAVGKTYAAQERVRYGEKLYRCVQAHISQADWVPDAAPALWTEVAGPGEIPVWKQPTGAQDAYNKGDRVWYPEKGTAVYENLTDGNVWPPDAYPEGWKKLG